MTHTVHPYAHRLGIVRDWKSRWFASDARTYRENIKVDETIRRFLTKRLRGTYTSNIEIERGAGELRVILSTARPGLVIGRSGENAAKLRTELTEVIRKASPAVLPVGKQVKFDINEVRQPETDAAVVAYMIAEGLEKRIGGHEEHDGKGEKVDSEHADRADQGGHRWGPPVRKRTPAVQRTRHKLHASVPRR